MDADDSRNPPIPFSSGEENPVPPLPPRSIPPPPSCPLPLSMAPPFSEPFSPFRSFESFEFQFESKPSLGNERGGGSGGGGDRLLGAPQPLESLYETPIPPFLSKTFDLVDDPSLDAIISWGVKGDTFVVWDAVEFSRTILPRNFKHNNFSSFVRQLNTYGFRKVDADKWEFANEGFVKGQRHLLKSIQRRKTPHSLQIGSSSGQPDEASIKAALDGEIEQLRKERSLMMQEVIKLQQQQRGTVQHMEMVNEKLEIAERRQKQMVSFLGKIFQNPAFLGRLQKTRDQKSITSPRSMRKFMKHHAHEPGGTSGSSGGTSGSSPKGQIAKYQHELIEPATAKQVPVLSLQDKGSDPVFGNESFQVGDVFPRDLTLVNEYLCAPEQAEPAPTVGTNDLVFKGKGVLGHLPQSEPEYLISFPEDLAKEKSVPEFSIAGTESMGLGESIWTTGFEPGAGMSSSTEIWDNVSNYDMPELGNLSDIWDISSLQLAEGSGMEKWPVFDSPLDETQNQEGRPGDDSSKD